MVVTTFNLSPLQIIFEGVAGTGFYGSDVSLDDINVTSSSSCSLFPKAANPVTQGPLKGSKLRMCVQQNLYFGTPTLRGYFY